jgi:hypothetical protein
MKKKYANRVVWLTKSSADSRFYDIFVGKKPRKTGRTTDGKKYYQGDYLGNLCPDLFVPPSQPNEGCIQVRIKIETVD